MRNAAQNFTYATAARHSNTRFDLWDLQHEMKLNFMVHHHSPVLRFVVTIDAYSPTITAPIRTQLARPEEGI